ncbi:MAG: D-glutamate cyclase family protein, partial [Brevibacterium aurantiacum]
MSQFDAAAGAEARERIRAGATDPTSGLAPGLVQANLIAVPADWAFDMLLFAQRNPKPCPVIDVLEPGQVESALASGSDLRTDIPRYRLWENGELVDEVDDATAAWAQHPDLVSFLIGCSFTFETGLLEAGIPIRHQQAGRNVPMYSTSIACSPAGRVSGNMVVSMRPIPAGQVAEAVRITDRFPAVHGG